ncbi:MAG: hypothetical protein WBB45_21565 [Cyclobacteriaceae bacterium]
MNNTLEDDHIIGLLNQITRENTSLTWKIRSMYGNGLDEPVREISICHMASNRIIGRIAYKGFSGQVVNYLYQGMKDAVPEHIVDMLLDVIINENQRTRLVSVS